MFRRIVRSGLFAKGDGGPVCECDSGDVAAAARNAQALNSRRRFDARFGRMKKMGALLGVCQSVAALTLFSCLPTGPIDGPDENGLIDFDEAEIKLNDNGERELVVRGFVPTPCYTVSLEPVTYIAQPDYWIIQVIAETDSEACAQVVTPYEARLVLDANVGKRGIEVVGKNDKKRINIE